MTTTQGSPPAADTTELTALVDRNLAAWSEPSASRRLEQIESCWETDGSLVDPPLDGQGHAGIDALMRALQEHYPGHRFVRVTAVDAHHDAFRVGWELHGPDGAVALTGTDVGMIGSSGLLRRITGFFGDLPTQDGAA